MNEIMSNEKTNNFKVEICTLQRRLKEKDKQIEDNRLTFENIISEFKVKISNMIAHNDSCTAKIEELELFNNDLSIRMKEKHDDKSEIDTKYEKLLIDHKKLIDSNVQDKRYLKSYNSNVKTLITKLFETFKSFNYLNSEIENLFTKALIFFDSTEKKGSYDYNNQSLYNSQNSNYSIKQGPVFHYDYNKTNEVYTPSIENKLTQVSQGSMDNRKYKNK